MMFIDAVQGSERFCKTGLFTANVAEWEKKNDISTTRWDSAYYKLLDIYLVISPHFAWNNFPGFFHFIIILRNCVFIIITFIFPDLSVMFIHFYFIKVCPPGVIYNRYLVLDKKIQCYASDKVSDGVIDRVVIYIITTSGPFFNIYWV